MKTAMQELIDYVDSLWSNLGWEETIKEKANKLLEKEKEQIIDAYCNGYQDGSTLELIQSDEYYNQIYEQNK
jgi:transcription initiation factor TFIIIB Brf1 subunit/transcription initiation factor TFIIB